MKEISLILPSLIALISLLISLFSLYIAKRKAIGEIKAKFIEKIIDKRIDTYPELWVITGYIYRLSEDIKETDFNEKWAKELHDKIIEWYYSKGNGVFLNKDTQDAFFKFEYALKNFSPEIGRKEIRDSGNKLRKELRADIKLESRQSEKIEI